MEWCIDANIAVKVVVKEYLSEKAKALISDALDAETRLIVPHFFDDEIYGAVRKKVYIGEITDREDDIAFEDLKGLPVQFMPTAYLCDRAWEIASSSISDGYMTHFTSLLQKKGHAPSGQQIWSYTGL